MQGNARRGSARIGEARFSPQEVMMDFILTFALIALVIVVPVVAGMAIRYGMRGDDGHA